MSASTVNLSELTRRLARRDGGAEANLQADVQTLLLYGGLNLGESDLNVELEAPAEAEGLAEQMNELVRALIDS